MFSVWISLMFPHGFVFVTGILHRWYSIFPKASNLEVYGERKKERKKVKLLSCAQLFATPWIVACTKFLCPWDFQGKSTGVGCHFLLQGIFPTQGSNPGLSHCRQTLYHLSHQGSPEVYGICPLLVILILINWLGWFFKFLQSSYFFFF